MGGREGAALLPMHRQELLGRCSSQKGSSQHVWLDLGATGSHQVLL